MDAGYGADTDLRATITTLGLSYVAGIMPNTSVWAPGKGPLPPKNWSGQGRPPKLIRRDAKHRPISVKALARGLPPRAWRTIQWREGAAMPLSSRFARVRVRVAHRDYWLAGPRVEEWLLIEWPQGENEPTKYWLSTLPGDITFRRLVDIAKLRWRIERDYHELKQEVGLGHFEGRGWRGFHHHATLCIAAYGFLISERGAIPPLYGALGVKHKLSMWQLDIGDGGYVDQHESGGSGLWTDATSVRSGRFEGSSPSGGVHRATTLYSVDPLGSGP
jgi:SRSO17 transposase